jgi:hypothetical protein
MKTLTFAAILGCLTEGVLIILCAKFGKMGPCGPANDIAGLVLAVHAPGLLFASALHLNNFLAIPIAIATATTMLSLLYLLLLGLFKFLLSALTHSLTSRNRLSKS